MFSHYRRVQSLVYKITRNYDVMPAEQYFINQRDCNNTKFARSKILKPLVGANQGAGTGSGDEVVLTGIPLANTKEPFKEYDTFSRICERYIHINIILFISEYIQILYSSKQIPHHTLPDQDSQPINAHCIKLKNMDKQTSQPQIPSSHICGRNVLSIQLSQICYSITKYLINSIGQKALSPTPIQNCRRDKYNKQTQINSQQLSTNISSTINTHPTISSIAYSLLVINSPLMIK